jgi:hypothetical protein
MGIFFKNKRNEVYIELCIENKIVFFTFKQPNNSDQVGEPSRLRKADNKEVQVESSAKSLPFFTFKQPNNSDPVVEPLGYRKDDKRQV